MEKSELRKQIRAAASELSNEYKTSAGRSIAEKLIASPLFKNADSIFIYVSTANEPDTFYIMNEAWKLGKCVYVPKCCADKTMKAIRLHGTDELSAGYMGIPEPSGIEEADTFALAVIPCLSASPDGKRLGHGAGFYDRFLEGCTAPKVCLCFGKLLLDDISVTSQDIYMDTVITEDQVNLPYLYNL